MNYQTIKCETREGVMTVTLNRPETLNAIDLTVAQELKTALAAAAAPEVRAVVLTGAGRAFSAGGDVKAMASRLDADPELFFGEPLATIHEAVLAVRQLPKPVVAAVNGIASGAGCNLALACDLRVAAESARFSQAFVKIGLTPDAGGTFILPRLVGWARATELLLTGASVDAREAERIGLVNRTVPDGELADAVWKLAAELAQGPTASYGRIKELLNAGAHASYGEQLAREQLTQLESGRTEDFIEGVKAFVERRRPVFRGR